MIAYLGFHSKDNAMRAFLYACFTALIGGIMPANAANLEKATFAGGCFWCMEPAFDITEGVVETVVGYTGGSVKNPTYEQVSEGTTGHVEAIEVTFDPAKVSYEDLLEIYWENVDPFDAEGQFADKGSQYLTAIFYHGDSQREAAERSRHKLAERFPGQQVATRILPAAPFYPAETYHQDYYKKNEGHYTRYKYGSGRVSRLKEIWEKEPQE